MRNIRESTEKALTVLLTLAFAVCAAAADGRIPIGSVPYTISAPGSYYLTASLTNGASQTAITIGSSNVTLDLCGHTLRTTSTSYSNIASTGFSDIRVSNGILLGGGYSVDIESVTAGFISIDGLSITGYNNTGITITGASNYPAVQITNNRITTNGGTLTTVGLSMSKVWGGQVASNVIVGAGTAGNDLFLLNNASSLVIMDNAITYGASGMNFLNVNGLRILRNNCSYNGGDGIILQGTCTNIDVEENLLSTNNSYGLQVTSGVASDVYRNNVATSDGLAAYAAAGCTNGGGNL